MPHLGVNIDHVATLRQARREGVPDPIAAALLCQKLRVLSIVAHLREDRRHIQDADVVALKKILKIRLNLEMSLAPEIVSFACRLKPHQATLVPEKRREITTEGGLDVIKYFSRVQKAVAQLNQKGICVSLFIDPVEKQILTAKKTGAQAIELHTGLYARARTKAARDKELQKLTRAAQQALGLGLIVHAGHGLNYQNARAIARIPGMGELNIGHAIIAQAVFSGLKAAVTDMLKIIHS